MQQSHVFFATAKNLQSAKYTEEVQGRIIHCAGCTMGEAPAARGPPPISCQFFTTLF